ncbi:MAG: C39 family peptidase [bacterium]|nr:C39 family peptidase [bacterium]
MARFAFLSPVEWSDERISTPLPLRGAVSAVPTWNADGQAALTLDLRARLPGAWTPWVPLAAWGPGERRSLNGSAEGIALDTDIASFAEPAQALQVRVRDGDPRAIRALAAAAPGERNYLASRQPDEHSVDLIVPERSQYVKEGERGWCSPTALSMLLAFYARRFERGDWQLDVERVAAAVYDARYGGTGNWAFNMAFAGSLGLTAFVAYLDDFEHARRFLRQAMPLVISYSWRSGELDGAPLEQSDGHLAVLRGMTSHGDPILNDPAHPRMRAIYPRAQLERLWMEGSRGLTYVVVPHELAAAAVGLAQR